VEKFLYFNNFHNNILFDKKNILKGLIIIPAYNEGESIFRVLEKLKNFIPENADVLVVNDSSKDNTVAETHRANIDCLNLPCNLGYTGALKAGLSFGLKKDYEWFSFMDADGQHRPEDMQTLIENFEKGQSDLIVGSRWLKENPDQHSSNSRRMGMLFFSWLTEKMTGQKFTDTTNGMKILSPKVAEELVLHNFGDFHSETLIYLHDRGFRISEHPIIVHDRETGTSMYSFQDALIYPLKNIILISIFKLNSWTLKRVKTQ
jgi:glycosyltransferase involved in cell wall biosynthesis